MPGEERGGDAAEGLEDTPGCGCNKSLDSQADCDNSTDAAPDMMDTLDDEWFIGKALYCRRVALLMQILLLEY